MLNCNMQNIPMSHIIYDSNERISRMIYFGHNGNKTNENYFQTNGEISMEVHYDAISNKVYEGQTREGKYHGEGTTFHNGMTEYIGIFKNGFKEGKGKLFITNSRNIEYDGNWLGNYYHGYGTLYYDTNTRKFVGNFKKGFYDGSGKLYNRQNQIVYEGNFKEGEFCGKGIQFQNGSKSFEGWFENGVAIGAGKEYYPGSEEVKYVGYWVNGKLVKGCHYNVAGNLKYDGYWGENGQTEGFGIIYSEGKIRYEGSTKNMKANGVGTNFYESCNENCRGKWEDTKLVFYELSKEEQENSYVSFKYQGYVYVGQVDNNMKPNGYGKLLNILWGNKDFQGMFKNGKRNGYGIQYYPYPSPHIEYCGDYIDDKKEGLGRFWDCSGSLRFEGFWKADRPVGALVNVNNLRQANLMEGVNGAARRVRQRANTGDRINVNPPAGQDRNLVEQRNIFGIQGPYNQGIFGNNNNGNMNQIVQPIANHNNNQNQIGNFFGIENGNGNRNENGGNLLIHMAANQIAQNRGGLFGDATPNQFLIGVHGPVWHNPNQNYNQNNVDQGQNRQIVIAEGGQNQVYMPRAMTPPEQPDQQEQQSHEPINFETLLQSGYTKPLTILRNSDGSIAQILAIS